MQNDFQSLIHIPHEWFRHMRASDPVSFSTRPPFLWSIFRYAEALQVLTQPEIFSSAPRPGSMQPALPSILGMDDPQHRKLRNIVARAFTPRIVEELTPRISSIVNSILDVALAKGEMDVVQELAYPLPVTIIAELLGVPTEDRESFRNWSSTLVSTPAGEIHRPGPSERQQAQQALQSYFAEQIVEHRRHPREDLLTRLIEAEVDGSHLSAEELGAFCQLLLIAGHETTANLIGNALVCFEEQPQAVKELRENPSLTPGAVEEILRCYPSVSGATRVATRPAILGGRQIDAGQTLQIFIASANYDEAQFPDPYRFDIRRDPNSHLGFGHGIHYCLGAPLARLEARIALTLLLARLESTQRLQDRPAEAVESFLTYGVKHYWIACKPRN